jgi:hypothetical protein
MISRIGRMSRRSPVIAKIRTFPISNWSFQAPDSSRGACMSVSIGTTPTLVNEPARRTAASEMKTKNVGTPMEGTAIAKNAPRTRKATANQIYTSSPRLSSGTTM